MLPTVRQMLHAMSSLKTKGVAASSIQIVPPMMVAIKTPKPVASALPMAAVATNQEADFPQQERANSPVKSQATSMYDGGELAVQTAGEQEDRHPNDRGKQAEVGVGPAVVHETLESECSVGQGQMAMEHGAGLEVVEVVLVDRLAERVGRAPVRPEDPDERHRREGDGDQRGPGESPPTDVERRLRSGVVGRPDVHGRVSRSTGRRHSHRGSNLKRTSRAAFPHAEGV